MTPPTCPFCPKQPRLVGGLAVYPYRKDLAHLKFWKCRCGAYVGCHKGTERPLGTLADALTRSWRSRTHEAFDPIWLSQHDRRGARSKAYSLLASEMGLTKDECHIGMFTVEQCKEALEHIPTISGVIRSP